MELTREEKMLKEAMKIILRDGQSGKFFEAAKARYLSLVSPKRLFNLSHELDIDWTKNYKEDVEQIEELLK